MQEVPIEKWMDAVLDLNPELLEYWTATTRGWKDDPTISAAMKTFEAAPDELTRYRPFCTIVNRVFELGRTSLRVSPAAEHTPPETIPLVTYPVEDINFYRMDPNYIRTGHFDSEKPINNDFAQRKPDVICVRSSRNYSANHRPMWAEVLLTCELKGPAKPPAEVRE